MENVQRFGPLNTTSFDLTNFTAFTGLSEPVSGTFFIAGDNATTA